MQFWQKDLLQDKSCANNFSWDSPSIVLSLYKIQELCLVWFFFFCCCCNLLQCCIWWARSKCNCQNEDHNREYLENTNCTLYCELTELTSNDNWHKIKKSQRKASKFTIASRHHRAWYNAGKGEGHDKGGGAGQRTSVNKFPSIPSIT